MGKKRDIHNRNLMAAWTKEINNMYRKESNIISICSEKPHREKIAHSHNTHTLNQGAKCNKL